MIIKKFFEIVFFTFILCCNLCFATSFDVNLELDYDNVAAKSILSTSSNIATIGIVSSTDSKSGININTSGRSTLEELKEISGNTEEGIYNEIASDEALGNMLSDLMNELRPYLKDVIDIDVNGYYVFSSKEVMTVIVKHPVKFLMAIYNYTVQSMKEIFNIAEENATVVTE